MAGAANDTEFDVDSDGRFEVLLGPGESGRNRLALEPDAGTVTTRHYFENRAPAAADPRVRVELELEPLDDPAAAPAPSDASIAAGIRRAANHFRAATLDQPPRDPAQQPAWVSTVPNQFNAPEKWKAGEGGFGAVDNAYAMAPYALAPDQALVIDGRWPRARFGSVVLWNRYMQTYDYLHRQVSLNRAQTVPRSDGSFRMVISGRDPGVPNWIDTAGRPAGLVFWRFQLPEEGSRPRRREWWTWSRCARSAEPPRASVVRMPTRASAAALAALALLACGAPEPLDTSGPTAEWRSYANGSLHHSPLSQITAANVDRLELAWSHHSGDSHPGSAEHSPPRSR